MNDGAGYHSSKTTDVYCRYIRLIRIDWPTQSPDLNPIENLWRIIKVQVYAKRHQTRSLKSTKKVIKEEWEKLMERDFRACIESMPK